MIPHSNLRPLPLITLTDEITVRPICQSGGDHMVVAAARVSTSGQAAEAFADPAMAGESAGLINYLMKHRHGTPFEHASLTFFVHAPVFVWWEWVRHRVGFSYNLESSRYKKLEPVFWVPRPDRRMVPAAGHRSARPRFDPASQEQATLTRGVLAESYRHAYRAYEDLIAAGIAGEVARAALPFSAYFSGWVTCNPRSLMAFLSLRKHDPAATFVSYPQAEIEQAADAAEEAFRQGWPLSHSAFVANGRVGP